MTPVDLIVGLFGACVVILAFGAMGMLAWMMLDAMRLGRRRRP